MPVVKPPHFQPGLTNAARATGKFSVEAMKMAGVTWQDVFQEIPIHVHNSSLATALMGQLAPTAPALQCDFDRLVLSSESLLEKNLEFINECLDDMVSEQSKVWPRPVLQVSYQGTEWNASQTGACGGSVRTTIC